MNSKSDYIKRIDIMKENFSLIVAPASVTCESAVIFFIDKIIITPLSSNYHLTYYKIFKFKKCRA